MNILVFSQASWDDKNSAGNTFSNLFSGWDDVKFYHFYTRKNKPENCVVDEYYCQSITDAFKRKKGVRFSKSSLADISFGTSEQQFITNLHKKKKREFIFWLYELLWRSRLWMNKSFKSFINEAEPDVFFAFATNTYILKGLFQYLDKNTHAKKILYIVDDVQNEIENSAFYRKLYLRRYLKRIICQADLVYGISPEMCEEYSRRYKRKVKLLYKGCHTVSESTRKYSFPLKFVYAGNLSYGRDLTLIKIVKALENINAEATKAVLEVYSTSPCESKLNVPGISEFKGSRPYEEIKAILSEADVILHVESFEEKNISDVRYSISTKIMDCLQSGRTVMAIGPTGISSVEFFRKIPGVYLADNVDSIEDKIRDIIGGRLSLSENSAVMRDYVNSHFNIDDMHERLRNEFEEIINK